MPFPERSRPGLLTQAASGGLEPASADRLRGADPHLEHTLPGAQSSANCRRADAGWLLGAPANCRRPPFTADFRGAKTAHSFRAETPHFPGKSGAFSPILVGDFWESRRLAATLILAALGRVSLGAASCRAWKPPLAPSPRTFPARSPPFSIRSGSVLPMIIPPHLTEARSWRALPTAPSSSNPPTRSIASTRPFAPFLWSSGRCKRPPSNSAIVMTRCEPSSVASAANARPNSFPPFCQAATGTAPRPTPGPTPGRPGNTRRGRLSSPRPHSGTIPAQPRRRPLRLPATVGPAPLRPTRRPSRLSRLSDGPRCQCAAQPAELEAPG